jgi:hypothetical protein
VKTTTRTIGRVHCPIEPETLLADIQGELSIDEARLVKQHIQTCERCQARSRQLREAYEQVATLADAPSVPMADVRDTVLRDSQGHLRTARVTRGLNIMTRGSLFAIAGTVAVVGIIIAFIARPLLQGHLLSSQPSQNTLTHPGSVGPGFFYAETIKLVPVRYNGAEWDLGEIIVMDEKTGQVVHSWPSSNQSPFVPELGIGSGADVQPALSADGKTLIEAAIPSDGHSPTAFAALDMTTGKIRYITRLTAPAGLGDQADPVIRQMWIGSGDSTIFMLTDISVNNQRSPHLLQFALANGQQENGVLPPLDSSTVLGGSATAIAPNGNGLYDAVPAVDATGKHGVQITFATISTHQINSTLFIPGDFQLLALAVSSDGSQIFLFNGKTATLYFISAATRSVVNVLPLQGTQPSGFTGTLTGDAALALSPDNQTLVAVADRIASNNRSFMMWTISVSQQSFLSLVQVNQPVGPVAMTSDGSSVVMLRSDGTLDTISASNPTQPQHWVILTDHIPVIQLAGAFWPASLLTPAPTPTATVLPVGTITPVGTLTTPKP